MKRIVTNGITDLEPLQGSSEWYWGADYASSDLHEAEEPEAVGASCTTSGPPS